MFFFRIVELLTKKNHFFNLYFFYAVIESSFHFAYMLFHNPRVLVYLSNKPKYWFSFVTQNTLMFSCITSQWWCWIYCCYYIMYSYIYAWICFSDEAKYEKTARLIYCNATKTYFDIHFYCFFYTFSFNFKSQYINIHIYIFWFVFTFVSDFNELFYWFLFFKTKELHNCEFNLFKCDICCYRCTTCVSNIFWMFFHYFFNTLSYKFTCWICRHYSILSLILNT